MKVKYIERIFLDRFSCIDNIKTRNFITCWVSGGITYFKENQFNIFTICNEYILKIEK